MSIVDAIAIKGNNKFVVPCAGKMFRSNVNKKDKALCFTLNKGYFETADLISMLSILDDVKTINGFVLVGKIEKVKLSNNKGVVYRQRLFFKSLGTLLNFCKSFGLRFDLDSNFHISINNILNCVSDLVYLERYARCFDESIDVWLTHCCIIELNCYLKSLNMYSSLESLSNSYLRNRVNYLGRAPFLIASYDIDKKSSSIFLGFDAKDKRLYKERASGVDLLKLGYTTNNVKRDIREGKFK